MGVPSGNKLVQVANEIFQARDFFWLQKELLAGALQA